MPTIHAILALHQRFHHDLMHSLLSREDGVRIVRPPKGQPANENDELSIGVRLHKLLDAKKFPVDDRVIVVTSIEDATEIPASISRLLAEFPEVTIVGICWATAHVRTFQLRIDVQEIPCSVKGLVEAIRECTRHPLPW